MTKRRNRVISKKLPVKLNINASLKSLETNMLVAFKMSMHDVLNETKKLVRGGSLVKPIAASIPRDTKWRPTMEFVKRYFGRPIVLGDNKKRREMYLEMRRILQENIPDRKGLPALNYTGALLNSYRVAGGLEILDGAIKGSFVSNSEYAKTHWEGLFQKFSREQIRDWQREYNIRVLGSKPEGVDYKDWDGEGGYQPLPRKIFNDESVGMFRRHFPKNLKAITRG